jgi:hypothetical protein
MGVTKIVFEQYKQIQQSGAVNMVNKSEVQVEANERGFHELVVFIEEGEYSKLLSNYNEYDEEFDV